MSSTGVVTQCLTAARSTLDSLLKDSTTVESIERLIPILAGCFRNGHKVLICGNGGSACDAAHFAEELTGRFKADRPPLPAIACTDPGHITCTANDYGFDHVFSRWVQALGQEGDTLILLSTSGNSPNILRAAAAAKEKHLTTIALLGKSGGRLAGNCGHEVLVPADSSERIQELHMLILHALVAGIEVSLFSK